MREITADDSLVAYCGLYCGACRKFLAGKCPGCKENEKATWCKVRPCCSEKQIPSCAECDEFTDVADCAKLNNFIAKVFAVLLRSDRRACIKSIQAKGYEAFAQEMAAARTMTIRK
jgi:Protein of unknown function (DUF3795)